MAGMTNLNPMAELCTLMLEQQLTSDAFAQWVTRHYGDPKQLGREQMDAIVEEFDRCLSPPLELSEDNDFHPERSRGSAEQQARNEVN